MIRKCLCVSTLALLMLCSAACQADKPKIDIQEGLWEITTIIEMPGMPIQMAPMKTTQCISQEDLIPQTQQPDQPDQQCDIANMTTSGNTITYDMTCSSQGNTMTAHSSLTYAQDQMQGTMTATMEPSHMSMTYTLSGKRIGDCTQ